jgi:hypothetical protein
MVLSCKPGHDIGSVRPIALALVGILESYSNLRLKKAGVSLRVCHHVRAPGFSRYTRETHLSSGSL